MKKKISALLAFILTFCMSVPVFAAGAPNYPTTGVDAKTPTIFTIQKNYVKKDRTSPADTYPDETLKFTATCTAAPVVDAPQLTVDDLKVAGVTSDIKVHVPKYTVPGKYNYEIVEQSPSKQTPASKDTAGVVYDETPIYLQVVVKYDNGSLKKIVTVAEDGTAIGAGNNQTQNNGNKKADFKNKYLLDGEIDPDNPDINPDPNPIPSPDPTDPVKPIPTPEGGDEKVEHAKFKIMKQVRGLQAVTRNLKWM